MREWSPADGLEVTHPRQNNPDDDPGDLKKDEEKRRVRFEWDVFGAEKVERDRKRHRAHRTVMTGDRRGVGPRQSTQTGEDGKRNERDERLRVLKLTVEGNALKKLAADIPVQMRDQLRLSDTQLQLLKAHCELVQKQLHEQDD